MKDFFTFKTMLTPWLIQILFWVSVVLCIAAAIHSYIDNKDLIKALETLFFGPVLVRMGSELLILFFRINGTLTEINHKMEKTN